MKLVRCRMDFKVFNDSVHGHMAFHPLIVSIIDTPQFQRLRNIKQLGLAYFVYPTACHNRFEHSLGTCHLAGKLLEALNRNRPIPQNQLEIAEREKEMLVVQIAGLCHDLGHGPFSHTWECFLHSVGVNWKHEESSVEVFDEILLEKVPDKQGEDGREKTVKELFRLYGLEDEIEMIKHLIRGTKPQINPSKYFLFQIINNKDNDIDVDKWDYVSRDKFLLNLPVTFDYLRLLEYCQILEVDGKSQICYRKKECSNILNMFITRGMLHNQAYQHVKVKIIEAMIVDALSHANERLNLSCTDVKNLQKLTDHVYQKILYEEFEEDEEMKKAKEILMRLEKRDLYVCIGTKELERKRNRISSSWLENITEEIYRELKKSFNLEQNDIKVTKIDISLSSIDHDDSENLLQNVYVFDKKKPGQKAVAEKFDWKSIQHIFKHNLRNTLRREIVVLYRGNDRTMFGSETSLKIVSEILNKIDYY